MNNPAPQTRRRRWFAFSLRTLLGLVTLTALFCGAFAVYVKPYWDEKRDWEILNAEIIKQKSAVPPWAKIEGPSAELAPDENVPEWLRRWAGEKNFLVLRSVDAGRGTWSEEAFDLLARFQRLQSVSFHNSQITDEGLRRFGNHPRLKNLDISDTTITDEGLSALRGCTNLRVLDLRQTKCTFAGLQALAHLPLETVYVSFPLTDEILLSGPPLQAIVPQYLRDDVDRQANRFRGQAPKPVISELVLERVSQVGLRKLATMHFWDHVQANERIALTIDDSTVTSTELAAIWPLGIKSLSLRNCRLEREERLSLIRREGRPFIVYTDEKSLDWETFAHAFLSSIKQIKLSANSIHTSDADLAYAAQIAPETWRELLADPRLAELETVEAEFSPPADLLAGLAALPHLTRLDCEADFGTDLCPLASAPALETLTVLYGRQRPEFWRFVREMSRLRELRVKKALGTAYMDARAMRELAAEGGVTHLSLTDTGVDDDGLPELAAMTKLERLELVGERWVTAAGLEELRQKRPDLKIHAGIVPVVTSP